MKCDELKPVFVDMSGNIVANELGELYYKPEVDAAIAELKAENLNLKAKNIELQSFYDLHGNVDNYIDKLKAENKRLKDVLKRHGITLLKEDK